MVSRSLCEMETSKKTVYIIGAGISGLIAAQVAEARGYAVVILEKSDSAGGRLKTIDHQGHPLDVGFQVLLDAYPLAKKYLDYEKLNLQPFLPGTVLFTKKGKKTIGDPLRHFPFLFPTLFSGIGSIVDKFRILKLNKLLKKKSIEEIFASPEKTTLNYLKDFGFSAGMISDFFRPFFTGIFLETELATSSRMFEFVYKLFGEGNAMIPKNGIAAIPQQLVSNLHATEIRYKTQVEQVTNEEIRLEDGEVILHEGVIIATEAWPIVPNMKNQSVEWKSCDCLYFETATRVIDQPLIGLIAGGESLINNIVYINQKSNDGKPEILSVTIVKTHQLVQEALILRVKEELKQWCGIEDAKFVRRFHIKKALPNLSDLVYEIQPSETQLYPNVFLAGDTLLYGSLNAAMQSGEYAAKGLIEKMEGISGL